MGDNHPITIYTDQDQAMGKAIEQILPDTRHRLCQWHIYKKLATKVHCGLANKIVANLFYKCMSKCESVEEFDNSWEMMIESCNLQDNVWLDEMYNIRDKWATAFNKDVFGMGILSTQRSESTNNICHGVAKPTSSITDCFLGLEQVMRAWRRNEKDEYYKSDQSVITPVAKSSPILRQASVFYSRKLYNMFELEFIHGSCGLQLHASMNNENEFFINNLDDQTTNRTWVVHYDPFSLEVQCSCRKFEMMGLLCAHALRVLNFLHIKKIPDKYLLLRWSANVKRDVYNNDAYKHFQQSQIMNDGKGSLIFETHMQKMSYLCTNKAKGNEEAELCMKDAMKKLSLNIDNIISGRVPKLVKQPKSKKNQVSNQSNLPDPAKMRPKGISNARLKGYWERRKRAKGTPVEVSSSQEPKSFNPYPNISSLPNFLTQNFFPPRHRESYTAMMTDPIHDQF
ncbi:protein FAR1-RELATED SEQUENCE 5-like [Phalaenopsis equestris]|uniref:protein FAR1-RELATED SEQUENCE 5-like n=1 Tax=Phalaenopsis equestris TaxID=78828 RepID=UPI0009E63904|nr:protein FAR1-RELATED SEQUENCE 5-like [Phalaenopsis equestris]